MENETSRSHSAQKKWSWLQYAQSIPQNYIPKNWNVDELIELGRDPKKTEVKEKRAKKNMKAVYGVFSDEDLNCAFVQNDDNINTNGIE